MTALSIQSVFWVFSHLVITDSENHLYHDMLSFKSFRKSVKRLRKLQYTIQAAVDGLKNFSLETQCRFFLMQQLRHLVSTAKKCKLQFVCQIHHNVSKNVYIIGTLYAVISWHVQNISFQFHLFFFFPLRIKHLVKRERIFKLVT